MSDKTRDRGQFSLHVTLGNEAMQAVEDVAETLRALGERMAREQEAGTCAQSGAIRDRNGNTVGGWAFTPVA